MKLQKITFTPEAFAPSAAPLSNPEQGFYHMFRYMLSGNTDARDEYLSQTASYSAALALLEINLRPFRTDRISAAALTQLNDILTAWALAPSRPKLILRFLYDWDGTALASEPHSLSLILTHMEQVSAIVNQHRSTIFLMQGIFIGNWGEMHHSRYMDESSVKTLMQQLHRRIDASIYLSVRTPSQWRMVTGRDNLPKRCSDFGTADSLQARLGLYNDGMLGSVSDLGTYLSTALSGTEIRKQELQFQHQLCHFVPNGGEAVYHPKLGALASAVSDLQTMRVSYLNADYDPRVLDLWKHTTWTGSDAFSGCDGYFYIQEHLGYRYRILTVQQLPALTRDISLSVTIQNDGFTNARNPFETSLILKHASTGTCTSIPFSTDLHTLDRGQKKSFPVKIPRKTLSQGIHQVYLSIRDSRSGQQIRLGNTNELISHGYLLGHLKLQPLK